MSGRRTLRAIRTNRATPAHPGRRDPLVMRTLQFRLDDLDEQDPTPLGFVLDVLVLIVPALVIVLTTALAVYFAV